MFSLLLSRVAGDSDRPVGDRAELPGSLVVVPARRDLDSGADTRGDNINLAPLLSVRYIVGRENVNVGVLRRGNIRVALQEIGESAESGNKRLALCWVCVRHWASLPSTARCWAGVDFLAVMNLGIRECVTNISV